MKSRNYNHIVRSTLGSFEFTEYALNVSSQLEEDLHVGVQFMGRDLGAFGNGRVDIDWAVLDYKFSENTGIRIGKMLTPVGFHNESRDIDLLRSTVLLPQSVYNETYRDTAVFRGATLYGERDLFGGILDFKVFTGAFNISDDSTFLEGVASEIGRQAIQNQPPAAPPGPGPPGPPTATEATVAQIRAESEDFLGMSLNWSPSDSNWRLGYSLYSAKIGMGGNLILSPGGSTDRIMHTFDLEKFQVLSAEYTHDRWKATFERADVTSNLKKNSPPFGGSETITEGYYGQFSYQLSEEKELAFTYSQFYPFVHQGKNSGIASAGEPTHRSYQTDRGLTYNVALSDQWTFKLEFHRMTGTGHVQLPSSPNFQGPNSWDLFNLERQVLEEQSFAKRILRVLQFREQFLSFYQEMNNLIGTTHNFYEKDPTRSNFLEHRRTVHTLKGTSGLFDFVEMMEKMHLYEEYMRECLESSSLPQLNKAAGFMDEIAVEFDAILRFLNENLGDVVDWEELTIRIPETDFRRILSFVEKTEASLHKELLLYIRRPFRNFFGQFQALLEELCASTDKVLHPLQIHGGEFMVDPNLYRDSLRLLVHIFRNSVDHGIEEAMEREVKGKDPFGSIEVDISLSDDHIELCIRDDGAGIDPEKIAQTLIDRKLKTLDEISEMTEEEIIDSLFMSGFSTAENSGLISGQGIGMDAVRSEMVSIGGSIELKSEPDQGTQVFIKLPILETLEERWEVAHSDDLDQMLIVDHDPLFLRLASNFIGQSKKFKVQGCQEFEEALNLMQENQFDVIVLEASTKLEEWSEFISEMRDLNPLLQVLMITANETPTKLSDTMKMGIMDLFKRPVTPQEILQAAETSRDRFNRWRRDLIA